MAATPVTLRQTAVLRRGSCSVQVSRMSTLRNCMSMAVAGQGVRNVLWQNAMGVRLASGAAKGTDSYHRRTGLIYVCAAGVFMLGMSYAGVPLYRMFCQVGYCCGVLLNVLAFLK